MTSSEIKHVPKGWGYEKWIVNNKMYCGKLLFFDEGKRCSWHYHKLKDETFYLQSGRILLYYGDTDDLAKQEFYEFTEIQLSLWGCKYHQLHLGKPSADYYIDDKGIHSDDFFGN